MEKWNNKICVVTGASSGIGASLAVNLVKSGLIVVGLARRVEMIEGLKSQLDGDLCKNLHSFKCDVADPQSIKQAFTYIKDNFGKINIIINNAGTSRKTKILDTSNESGAILDDVIDINFKGLINCTRAAFEIMDDDYGFIININSLLGHKIPWPISSDHSHNVYAPTKFAVSATSEVLRQELIGLKNTRIRVSNISPGLVDTDIFALAGFPELKAAFDQGYPVLKPKDIFDAVAYILSTPYAVNITEITIRPVGESF